MVVGVLVYPGFQLLDAAGPLTVFEETARETAGASYQLRVLAAHAGQIRSSAGINLAADRLSKVDLDTLIVAGGWGSVEASESKKIVSFVRAAARRVRRIASVCSGAFVLAAAGLLDGRRATTHWGRATELAQKYPRVKVEADRIFIRDGPIWTSAGVTAGIDLALALVAEDVGEETARRVAQQMVVYYRRPGGQSQFSALIRADRPGSRFSSLLGWARERLAEDLPVERLAERAAMSPRHFARTFVMETGTTPAKAIEHLRLEAAREQVENSAGLIEVIAERTGFRDPERMRRAFLRAFGQPPQALRRISRTGRVANAPCSPPRDGGRWVGASRPA